MSREELTACNTMKGACKAVLEKDIESYLRDEVKKIGGKAYKWVSPGNNGVPDRIVLLPSGRVVFVELKAKGKTPSPLQLAQHRKIRALGFSVFVIDSKEGVRALLEKGCV